MVDTRTRKTATIATEVESEPDIPMMSLNFETPEEIQRIVLEADGLQEETPAPEEATKKKRKPREDIHTSDVWTHFKRGPKGADGFLMATCNYCGMKYKQRNRKSTFSGNATATGANPAVWVFDQARSRKNLGKMVIAHEYLFNCATHHYFKVFVSDLQPLFKIVSRTTIRADCLSIYEEEKVALYQFFSKLDCRFSFTSDLWTCKGRDRGFMALTCHYIDDAWNLRKKLISFTALPSPHTGKHIAQAIHDQLVLWNLDKKAFSLELDNSTANDACITVLFATTPIQKDLHISGAMFHQRCACHILNLIVQDGLNVLNNEIANIRETMKYIRHSQARMEKFSLAASQVGASNKKLAWDVQTRWNSTYLMLELALELREAINRYATLDKRYTSNPSEQEWERVKMGLEMFYKWDKYWKDENIILAIACVLDPRCKLEVVEYYIEQMYPEECDTFMSNMNICMNQLFKESSSSSAVVSDTRAGMRERLRVKKSTEPGLKSEIEEYLAQPLDDSSIDDHFDILSWWKLKSPKYHVLARLAREIFAIPISTVASKSTFSTSGRTLHQGRSVGVVS
ncbi:hypothetical protein LUZ63_002898 [Rhynchospora breviuscula]|uniref:Transposase n=1 Tax=Rhynchospora breviuscula TaxID=2022672 RepID=A0A9Q0CZP1_9POAL|nr:hypothetical protein LUZ63_002898 [Rhynchospora breviuscula]